MDPLATVDDLELRKIDTDDVDLVDELLAVASAQLRAAAGSPISQVTSTVSYTGWAGRRWLRLFGPPIVSVDVVLLDDTAVDDWRLAGDRLWRRCGWGDGKGPTPVKVTQTHGLPTVPPHIVDLACSFVAAGLAAAAEEGYEHHGGKVTERIDDYSVTWATDADAVATAMEVPRGTRRWLAAQFGGSADVVSPGR